MKRIAYSALLRRGFGKFEKKYKWYSWLRFKSFAQKNGCVDDVLANENMFLKVLSEVHEYYRMNPTYAENEGLEAFQGPQAFHDRTNEKLLHYYGKGWYQWYKNQFLSNKW